MRFRLSLATAATVVLLAFSSLSLWCAVASASDTGVIVGARAGISKTHDYSVGDDPLVTDEIANLEDSDFAWEVFAGYQFVRWLAFEASYVDLGELTADGPAFGGFTEELSTSGWNFAGKLMVPLAPRFGAHATAGAFVWKQEVEYDDAAPGIYTAEDTGTGASAGVGLHLGLTPALRLEADATRYFKVGDPDGSGHEYDRDFFRAGLRYFFDLAGTMLPSD